MSYVLWNKKIKTRNRSMWWYWERGYYRPKLEKYSLGKIATQNKIKLDFFV